MAATQSSATLLAPARRRRGSGSRLLSRLSMTPLCAATGQGRKRFSSSTDQTGPGTHHGVERLQSGPVARASLEEKSHRSREEKSHRIRPVQLGMHRAPSLGIAVMKIYTKTGDRGETGVFGG